ncbi:MAG: Hpt domain-containing protein [bacterium]
MLDRNRFNENFVYLDKEVIVEIIDIFLGEYQDRFNKIQKNLSENDINQLRFNAHSLKGVIANFMDPVTIELSRLLDEKAKQNDTTDIQELVDNLKQESESLAEELRVIRGELTS